MRFPLAKRFSVAVALIGLAAGCGGSDVSGVTSENQFTVAEATTIASAILTEVSKALSTAVVFNRDASAAAAATVPTTSTATVNGQCTAGGAITGSYTVTIDLASNGTGTEKGTFTVTPKGCKVSTGTRTIAVDGSLTYTFDMTLAQTAQLSQFKWRGFGDFTWSGGSCKMDYTMTLAGSKSTLTGSFCGVNISSST